MQMKKDKMQEKDKSPIVSVSATDNTEMGTSRMLSIKPCNNTQK